ncbi:LysM peptidoglycan-binding domain-containing protein [Leifsonia sp. H3M29-4]|uniref:LysM peptidoglycan-binding domain-containing protein n=1 Tax=Salinibacterium metalliresistens TaxID=3031321 RepID=UPI0023D9F0BC|nr:LysM peptidoglycan-binding domain-containing protein [Salinibacterium metalliresistens]MDF1478980.1 LysM peptidoglycan-binding domain-containing protein [Salinibacterium metalliresistens]
MSAVSIGFGVGDDAFRAPRPRLRLTKRGRGVLTTLAAAPLVVAAFVFALNGGGATASLEGSDVAFQYVTVDSGESLWQLAETIAPGADPRDVIERIVQLNQLDSSEVFPGQQLAIPAEFAR